MLALRRQLHSGGAHLIQCPLRLGRRSRPAAQAARVGSLAVLVRLAARTRY